MPKRTDIKTIMIIGAGPIVIGQACEFDYSGAQACKALREEGYRVVLINSNPATIMTDPDMADATYIEPITPIFIEKIIPMKPPRNVPVKPIIKPMDKKTLIKLLLLRPIVFNIGISLFFSLTKIINPDTIFIDATIIIKVKIKNITFFSTFKALIKAALFSFQEEV